jgi:hypothetical protein
VRFFPEQLKRGSLSSGLEQVNESGEMNGWRIVNGCKLKGLCTEFAEYCCSFLDLR